MSSELGALCDLCANTHTHLSERIDKLGGSHRENTYL